MPQHAYADVGFARLSRVNSRESVGCHHHGYNYHASLLLQPPKFQYGIRYSNARGDQLITALVFVTTRHITD